MRALPLTSMPYHSQIDVTCAHVLTFTAFIADTVIPSSYGEMVSGDRRYCWWTTLGPIVRWLGLV